MKIWFHEQVGGTSEGDIAKVEIVAETEYDREVLALIKQQVKEEAKIGVQFLDIEWQGLTERPDPLGLYRMFGL